MKRKLIKTNTVLIRRSSFTERYRKETVLVPFICFSGLFLNGYGFDVGRRYDVYAQKDQLVLKAKEFKYENPIIKEEAK